MKELKKLTAFLALVFSLALYGQNWGVSVRIKEGECKGEYKPLKALEENNLYELIPTKSGKKRCAQLAYEASWKKDIEVYFFGIKYLGQSPPGAENSFTFSITPPPAQRLSGARVSFIYWTEPFYRNGFRAIPAQTQFIIWQDELGDYGAMIPLVGAGMRSILYGAEGKIEARASSYVSDFVPKDVVPMLAIAEGENPYQVVKSLYEYAMEKMGWPGKLRWQKPYPEVFEYIGWCSWNAHYTNIDHQKLIEHAKIYKGKNFPIGFFLIDDGWLSIAPYKNPLLTHSSYLTSFEADKEKFPQGLKGVVEELKSMGVKYVGVWHTFQGYWSGVLNNSELAKKEKDALFAYSKKGSIPHPLDGKGEKFYSDWYEFLKKAGIDFVKVDNQSTMSSLVKDKIPISFAMAGEQRNLQRSAGKYFNYNVINCMEMNIDVVYHWWGTNIGRTSTDYIPKVTNNPRAHIHKNIMNALWFTNLSYPDYDMFQTHNIGAQMHAVARAISGGPIYTTDEAGKEKLEVLYPLIFSDGKILRPDQPALPTRDSLFEDPRFHRKSLKAFTISQNKGIVAGFNVNYLNLSVAGKYSPKDVDGLLGEQFAVYEYFSHKLEKMKKDEAHSFKLKPYQTKLWIFSPIKNGFASIGLIDKYISPKAILKEQIKEKQVKIKLYEGGRFLAYSEREPRKILINGKPLSSKFIHYNSPALELDLSQWKGKPIELEIIF